MARASYQHIPNIHLGVKKGKTIIVKGAQPAPTVAKRVFPSFPTPDVQVRPKPSGRAILRPKFQ